MAQCALYNLKVQLHFAYCDFGLQIVFSFSGVIYLKLRAHLCLRGTLGSVLACLGGGGGMKCHNGQNQGLMTGHTDA